MTYGAGRARFVRYVVAGLVNTAASYTLLIVLMQWVGYLVAYSVAYTFGIALGYWLQTRFVFHASMRWGTAMAFPIGYLVQYLAGLAVLSLLVERFTTRPDIAALIVVVMNVPLGYIMNRYLLAAQHSRGRPGVAINPESTRNERQ